MIWGESLHERHERITNWHAWFAWKPTRLTEGPDAGRWVWREVIQRRTYFTGYPFFPHEQYRRSE